MRRITDPYYWLAAALFLTVLCVPGLLYYTAILGLCLFTSAVLILGTKCVYWACDI